MIELQEKSAFSNYAMSPVFHKLLYTVFQRPRDHEEGMVVALTSANPQEGVSYVSRSLVEELASSEISSVAHVNARFLRRVVDPTRETFQMLSSRSRPNVSELGISDTSLLVPEQPSRWDGSWQYRRDCVNLLRKDFDYTIVDCPSLRESGVLLSIAPFVDGVILVVEANRTRKEQILHAERNIEAAQGNILGHVLNKRTYQVPGWIYRLL